MTEPWLTEPDRADFEAEGFACAIRRSSFRVLNGYVGVGQDHPWFGLPRNAIVKLPPSWWERRRFDQGIGPIDAIIHALAGRGDPATSGCEISMALEVHGGISYADDHAPFEPPDGRWWFGFDCGHAGDYLPTMPLPDRIVEAMPEHVRAFLRKGMASGVYRDIGYVTAECQALAQELAAVAALSTAKVEQEGR
jgi:hypothetical protein